MNKAFSLNTGRDDLAALGLIDVDMGFDVDSQGAIYIGCLKNADAPILKFDRRGNFVRAFSRAGQGPGEIQGEANIAVSAADELVVTNTGSWKVLFFAGDGKFIREHKLKAETMKVVPLPSGKYITWGRVLDAAGEFLAQHPLNMTASDFEVLRELDRQNVPNPLRGGDFLGTFHVFSWCVSEDRVYSAFQDRGYDIWVHDLEGELVRKIRKKHVPVPVSSEFKRSYLKLFEAPLFDGFREKIYFPSSMPPLDSIFSDDEGRLYVLTYEVAPGSQANVFDIFDRNGNLEGRMSVKAFHADQGCLARARNGRLYVLAEDANGDKEIVVYDLVRNI
jgi:hypothetical protein